MNEFSGRLLVLNGFYLILMINFVNKTPSKLVRDYQNMRIHACQGNLKFDKA